jgi:hypothetical protein
MLTQDQKQILRLQDNIATLAAREERYMYLGLLSEYQLQPELIIQKLEYTKLNPAQHFLFKRVLHGLNMYTPEEQASLHWDKKRRIKKVWQRGQQEVNAWKQILCNKYAQKIFSFFNNTETGQFLNSLPVDEIDPSYTNTMSLKDLGIKYEDLILFYMSKGLLPRNFLLVK